MGSRQRRELEEQIKRLKEEQRAREDARTASTPDFWEINRDAGADDTHRLLEREWRQRYMAVQLNSSPKYRTVFPTDDKLAQMKNNLECIAAPRKRRLSKRPSNTKSDL